jgi:hypothetical protein
MPETTKCPNPACGAASRPGAAFCSKCGTKLEQRCPNPQCGAVLRGGENFCAKCGTPLKATPAASGPGDQGGTTVTGTSKARLYLFPTDKGGRHTPVFRGYRPELIPQGSNQKLKVEFVDGYEMIMPGQSAIANVRLLENSSYVLKKGDRFTVFEDTEPDPDLVELGADPDDVKGGLRPVGELEIL